MQSGLSRVYERVHQPEYTGENRCIPCTSVNVVIALVVAGGIALWNRPIALVAFVLSLAAIYVRGYLVPGTPTLTKRYFPDWLLAKFDKEPEPVEAGIDFDAIEELRSSGANSDEDETATN
ncbi:hypothetical protein GCM10025298_22210 [Natronobiforma cellulositropha]|nr:hypothetical protein [Natronobiforma cellulositropha]